MTGRFLNSNDPIETYSMRNPQQQDIGAGIREVCGRGTFYKKFKSVSRANKARRMSKKSLSHEMTEIFTLFEI